MLSIMPVRLRSTVQLSAVAMALLISRVMLMGMVFSGPDQDVYKRQVEGCLAGGTLAFTGDGMNPSMFSDPVAYLKTKNGLGVPTVKPWDMQNMKWRIEEANDAGVLAVCSDIDASGLTGLRNSTTPVEYKSVEDLKQISACCQSPFIVKGILSVDGAMKALEANASGIVVSNHGDVYKRQILMK